jgi:hypothetical protein
VIRQGSLRLSALIEENERRQFLLTDELTEDYERLMPLFGALSYSSIGKVLARRGHSIAELLEVLRGWAQKRIRLLCGRAVTAIYRKMLGNAPEYVREVKACRKFLTMAADELETQARGRATTHIHDHQLLPDGSPDLAEAADKLLDALLPEAIDEFEETLQANVRRHCRAVISACLSTERGVRFKELLKEQAREFLSDRIEQHSPTEEFFRCYPDRPSVTRAINAAVAGSAAPSLGSDSEAPAAIALVSAPDDKYGRRLRTIIRELSHELEEVDSSASDAIVFFQERHDLTFADLPHSGPVAATAVREVWARQNTNPHSRTDVGWPPLPGE